MPTQRQPDLFERTFLEASFENVTFPVSEFSTEGGHDIAVHSSYLKTGAEVEPCGFKALKGKLVIPMLNGIGYPNMFPRKYLDFRNAIKQNGIGTFVHPLEGSMTASLHSFKVVGASDVRSGVWVDVDWIEHNATALTGLVAFGGGQDTPNGVQRGAENCDALMDDILGSVGASSHERS